MAIAKFDIPPARLPHFRNLAFSDTNAQTEMWLESQIPSATVELQQMRVEHQGALRAKIEHTLKKGQPVQSVIDRERITAETYFGAKTYAVQADQNAAAQSLSRWDIDISPFQDISGKNRLDHPYPAFSAAMDALWPGFDPEYREFMKRHGMQHHFPERIASLGIAFVAPPYLPLEEKREVFEALQTADPYWRRAPVVDRTTSAKELRMLLMHCEDDYVATVVEDLSANPPKVLGFVGREELGDIEADDSGSPKRKSKEKVGDFFDTQRTSGIEMTTDPEPEEAFAMLNEGEFLYRVFDDGLPRIITRKTAAYSKLLPPFKHKNGLGGVAYFGMGDPDTTKTEMSALESIMAGAIVETAHSNREDFRSLLFQLLRGENVLDDEARRVIGGIRDRFKDMFLIAGTTTNPVAVSELLTNYADCVKVGIAGGGHCNTRKTGVELPEAWVTMECGAAAYGRGTIIGDGWGSVPDFCKRVSMHAVRGAQGGGSLGARRESAMPFIKKGKKGRKRDGKFIRGMAHSSTDRDRRSGRTPTVLEQMRDLVHQYSEGHRKWNELRDPSTISEFAYENAYALRSAMTYGGVRPFIEQNHMDQFQTGAELYFVESNGDH